MLILCANMVSTICSRHGNKFAIFQVFWISGKPSQRFTTNWPDKLALNQWKSDVSVQDHNVKPCLMQMYKHMRKTGAFICCPNSDKSSEMRVITEWNSTTKYYLKAMKYFILLIKLLFIDH